MDWRGWLKGLIDAGVDPEEAKQLGRRAFLKSAAASAALVAVAPALSGPLSGRQFWDVGASNARAAKHKWKIQLRDGTVLVPGEWTSAAPMYSTIEIPEGLSFASEFRARDEGMHLHLPKFDPKHEPDFSRVNAQIDQTLAEARERINADRVMAFRTSIVGRMRTDIETRKALLEFERVFTERLPDGFALAGHG